MALIWSEDTRSRAIAAIKAKFFPGGGRMVGYRHQSSLCPVAFFERQAAGSVVAVERGDKLVWVGSESLGESARPRLAA